MIDVLGSVFWLIVALGLLVTFHEYGHYWVARRFGIKVLRFSVGFGRPLWSRQGKNGTDFAVAAIPLGGYVKMLDEREGAVPEEEQHLAFNNKPVLQRIGVVVAGPAFNMIFAIAAFWLMFMIGIQAQKPILGETAGMAALAGLEQTDEITAVGEKTTKTWTHVYIELVTSTENEEATKLTVQNRQGEIRQVFLPMHTLPEDADETQLMQDVGISRQQPNWPARIDELSDGGAARGAGLLPGDIITAINSEEITHYYDLHGIIQKQAAIDPVLQIAVSRDGLALTLPLRAIKSSIDNEEKWRIGVSSTPDEETQASFQALQVISRYGPVDAFYESLRETWTFTTATFSMLKRMITGQASLKNLSGPVSIAKFANDSAALGIARFLSFLGILSLSLAILNILPIPVLDGGHLLYYLFELVTGKPVGENTLIIGQYLGLAAIVSLMSIALYNDLLRIF